MFQSGRGGRGRFRRDHPPRSEEKSNQGRNSAPPSRHLWVGNLSHDITEKALANHFLQFGELESISFQPGRSYAFINFKYDEEAFVAVRALQGFVLAGSRLKIEFAKAEKSSTSSRDDDFLQRQRSEVRGSPSLHRDSRIYQSSPDRPDHPDKRKMTDRNAEPSEVLWIGFPALLKVDEVILRKAFSPFGEIEKITAFPGRSYAFVRFKNVMSACRAKETLQGKLFGNPRVHICFAKSESGSSNSGKNSTNAPPSPRFRLHGPSGFSENFRHDRNFGGLAGDPTMISPRFMPNYESGDPDIMGFPRSGGGFEQRRFQPGPEMGFPDNMYERHGSPTRERAAHFRDFPPQFPQKGHVDEDDWDLPEDDLLFHGNKKLKTSSFLTENELPEFPLTGLDQGKHAFHREFPDFPRLDAHGKVTDPGPFGYKQIPDRAMNLKLQYGERSDHRGSSYDSFQAGSGSLPPNPVERRRLTPEPRQPSLSEEWKWEGIIAKGGTPVCRARCFPKGKVLDMPLPELLDCTARTGLDMLAKHYYQAASTWVVFFVPESDADIGFYNEFMHYLEEKQRAAVAKLDERTTLFLVPPSDFSEKVLKVPGKLSISGVILRLEHPGSNLGPAPQHPQVKEDTNFMPYRGDTTYARPKSPSGPFPSMSSYPNMAKSVVSDLMIHQQQNRIGLNPNSGGKIIAPQGSNSAFDSAIQGYNPSMPRPVQETSSSSYTVGTSAAHQGTMSQVSSSTSVSALQPDQLAQLASSLLGQPRQSSGVSSFSMGEDFRQSNAASHSGTSYQIPQNQSFENNPVKSEFSTSQFGQVNSHHRLPNPSLGPQSNFQMAAQGNQSSSTQDEDLDPQKRLQATLQLAAALLQQIQQGKGT